MNVKVLMLILAMLGFAASAYLTDSRPGWAGMIFFAVAHMI